MSDVDGNGTESASALQRQIQCVGQLAASTVLVDQGLGAALREITELAAQAMELDRISIWRHNAEAKNATCLEAFDQAGNSHEQGQVVELPAHLPYLAELGRTPVLAVADTSRDERMAEIREKVLDAMGIGALLYTSIRREGQFIGSMVFSKFGGPHDWKAEEQAFAGVFAEFVSRNLESHERRETEAAFKDFADSTSDWFWETDSKHRLTYLSDRFFAISGENPSDIIGRHISEIGIRVEDPAHAADFQRALTARQPFRDIINVRTLPSGKEQWVRANGVPILDEAGEFKGYRGGSADVTETIQLQQALQARELSFRALIDAAPQPLSVTLDGKYLYGNRLAQDVLGVSADEIVGMRVTSIYQNPSDRDAIVSELETRGFINEREVKLRRGDGRTFWASLSANVVDYHGRKAYLTSFADITRRKATEEKLASNAALLQTIFDAVPGSLSYRDLDGRLRFMNKHAAGNLGKRPGEIIGKTLTEVLGETSGVTVDTLFERVLETKQPVLNSEIQPPRIPGRVFNYNMVPVEDQSGAMIGVVAASNEITEQKKADDELRRSEAKFRSVVENSIQGLCIEREAHILFANQALADIFGYEAPEDILALESTRELLPPNEAARLGDFSRKRLKGKAAPNNYRAEGRKRDGRTIWLDCVVHVVDWDGAPAVQATIVDVTAEVEAATAHEQLANALDHLPAAVVLFDRDDRLVFQNATHRAEHWSPLESELENPTFEEIVREMALKGKAPEAEGRIDEWVRERVALHREKHGPVRTKRMRDTEVWQDQYDFTTSDGGSLLLFVDATKLHEQEELLREAQKMETIGQLTGGVAHDFNNILAVIQGNLDLLADVISADDQGFRFLEPATRATQRGADLTHRLLAFARRQPLKLDSVDLAELIQNMDGMLKSSLGETVSTSLISKPGLWPCTVDPAQLEQAILNLALNARDAMPGGGNITFEISNTTLDADTAQDLDVGEGDYIMLLVSDNGSGMSEEISERIFDPFFTTKDIGQGTGLGLSMAFGLVKQSAGHISVSSEIDIGTTFKILLPRAKNENDLTEAGLAMDMPRARPDETVLVVEDDDDVRSLVVKLLNDLGYAVLEAHDGPSARELWQSETRIDLLLSDVILPGGMAGPDIAAAALIHRPELKILYMSGYTDDAIVHHGRLDPDIELIQKPFVKTALARRVRLILDN